MGVENPTATAASAIVGRARGAVTPAAPGAVATFNIPHGLGSTPAYYGVTPRNALSLGTGFVVTADATNLIVTFLVAPSAGALSFVWSAEL